MRPYVEPPPTLHCMCGTELRLKLIEPADRTHRKQREVFVCTNCGREQTLLADRSPYVAFTASDRENIQRHRTKLGVWIGADNPKGVRKTAHKQNASVASDCERDQDAIQDVGVTYAYDLHFR
jgi:hypothetical protein